MYVRRGSWRQDLPFLIVDEVKLRANCMHLSPGRASIRGRWYKMLGESAKSLSKRESWLMKRSVKIVTVCWIFVVSGCTVDVDVSRFHTMTPDMIGKSFSVLPRAKQKGSLEFMQYGRRVAAKLAAHGFRPLSDQNQADLHVFLSYSIDDGKAVAKTTTSRGVIREGYWVGKEPNRIWIPSVYGVTEVMTSTEIIYRKILTMEIVDARRSRGGEVYKVFEANVRNSSNSDTFHDVSECMIEGLFKEFPGISGRTITYAIDTETCIPKDVRR